MATKTITCDQPDNFDYAANAATGAGGYSATEDAELSSTNDNCPDGYIWGGLECVLEETDQDCSTDYRWTGAECLADDDDFECATGYRDINDECVTCPSLTPPVASKNAAILRFVATNPFGAGAELTLYYSVNGGAEESTGGIALASGTYTFQLFTGGSTGINAGSEVCAYFRGVPVSSGEWDECTDVYSQATCFIWY